MDYNVFVTPDAKEDLEEFIHYLLAEKKSRQAAMNVLDDFEATKKSLATVAGSIKQGSLAPNCALLFDILRIHIFCGSCLSQFGNTSVFCHLS